MGESRAPLPLFEPPQWSPHGAAFERSTRGSSPSLREVAPYEASSISRAADASLALAPLEPIAEMFRRPEGDETSVGWGDMEG